MDHRPFAILFALAAFATPALAADIDEVAFGDGIESADVDTLGAQEKTKRRTTRTKKNKKVTVTRTTRNTRASRRTVRVSTARPVAAGHTRGAVTVHTARPAVAHRTVTYRRVTPAHGVFVYGPQRRHHHHYHGGSSVVVQTDHMPTRAVDRTRSLALGIKGGTFFSGTQGGDLYSDFGLGLMTRYRPTETVGLQLDVGHHAGSTTINSTTSVRNQTQVAASVDLFAFPWAPVSPYVLGGMTYNGRNVTDRDLGSDAFLSESSDGMWGLHGGLGLEIALGQTVALDLEGRYVGWLARDSNDPLGAIQGNVGMLFHF